MTDFEQRARDAFSAVELPEGLNERTLAAIEAQRVCEAQGAHETGAADAHGQDACEQRVASECGGRDGLHAESAMKPKVKRAVWPRRIVAAAALAACFALAFVGLGVFGAGGESEHESGRLLADNPLSSEGFASEEPSSDNPPLAEMQNTAITAYVTLDMNPSIELQLNSDDAVVVARGLNDDGRAVLAGAGQAGESLEESLEGLPLEKALALLTSSDAFGAYLRDDSYIALSVVCDDERQRGRVMQVGENCLAELPCQGSCHAAGSEEREEALAAGMGVQRYRAAQELMALDPSLTLEECASMSMRELRDRIAALL